jgi:hypothetical protein
VGAVREWAAQCHKVDTGLLAQLRCRSGDGLTRRLAEQHWDRYDSQAVLEDRRGEDSPFDPGAHVVPEHLMLWSAEWVRGPRARGGHKRGGDSPEGASSPRARRRFRGAAPGP